jgi:hypothetical protein
LLSALRHADVDLLAYDGTLCSEAASPLAEAARRIEADPDLRSLFLFVIGCDDDAVSQVVKDLRRVAQNYAQRRSDLIF